MANNASTVTFYPVGNGDCSQIVLKNGRRILMDYRHLVCSEEEDTPVINLKKKLLSELKAAEKDYFDVVAFTHADLDHICGFSEFFELQYLKTFQGNGRIKINELWVPAAVLLEPATKDQKQDDFYYLREEAKYRLIQGKGIKVFSKPQEVVDILKKAGVTESRDHCFVDAGTIVDTFNLNRDGVEFFVHSPFIEHCADGDFVRNLASLVFNVRFLDHNHQGDYLAVGDTEYTELEKIVKITEYHKRTDRLRWDLFNIPHHCSYKALGPDKGDYETTPTAPVERLLLSGNKGAYIVSSSLPIKDSASARAQTLPPHVQAAATYKKYLQKVGGRRFIVTMEEPNEEKPQPLTFEFTSGGFRLSPGASLGAAAGILGSSAPRAGLATPRAG